MARQSSFPLPRLYRHNPSKQGRVRLAGKDHYLGFWPEGQAEPPDAVREAYDRLIASWLANHRRALPTGQAASPGGQAPCGFTVSQLVLAYLDHVETYYRHPDGQQTSEVYNIKQVLKRFRGLYGRTDAATFDAVALDAFRAHLVSLGLARVRVNKDITRVRAMFKWAAGPTKKPIPRGVYLELKEVDGLKLGRSAARETEDVRPVPDAWLWATLPHVPTVVATMILVQRYTGMRPAEVCRMRGIDLDRSGPVWWYRPGSDAGRHGQHKTSHKGIDRVVAVGPRAQVLLAPWITADPKAYLFPPQSATLEKTGRGKGKGKRQPGNFYRTSAYGHAVRRGCRRANLDVWSPNRIRHLHATMVRRRFGLEAAQVTLGHSEANTTEIYAQRDRQLAARVARDAG